MSEEVSNSKTEELPNFKAEHEEMIEEMTYETTFGELKAGDSFFHQCGEYEKISGNYAEDIRTKISELFQSNTKVRHIMTPFIEEVMAPNTVIGYLIEGNFYCVPCTEKKSVTNIPIKVHAANIGQYSQQCSGCQKVIIDGFKNYDGSPVNLLPFKKSTLSLEDWNKRSKQLNAAVEIKDWEAAQNILNQAMADFLSALKADEINAQDRILLVHLLRAAYKDVYSY